MKIKYLLLLVLIPLILVLFWFRNGNVMGGGESGLPFYNLSRMLEISRHAWAEPALGNSIGIGVAATPTYWILSQLQNLGIPGYFIQGLLFASILSVAGLSVYLLTKEVFPSLKNQYTLLAAFFYWFNPFSLINVWNRFLNNYMFFWALLPLALYLYLKGIREKKLIYSVIVSLTCGIFSYALTSVPFNMILWGVFAYTSIFYLFFSKTKSERIFILSYFFATLTGFVLINFWWISQLLATVISPQIEVVAAEFFTSEGNLSTMHTLSSLLGWVTDTARLMHATFAANSGLWWAKIYNIWPVSILLFVPTAVVFWAIYHFRRNKEVLYLGILFVLSLFLVKGSAPPFGEIYEFIFTKVQVFQVFRNPFEKFGFLLPLVFAPLLGFGLYQFAQKYQRLERRVYILCLIIVVVVMGFPFWTGLVFTRIDSRNGKLVGYEVQVPDYYQQADSWLKERLGDLRFMSLPVSGEGMDYLWAKPYSGVELSSAIFSNPNISFVTSVPYFQQVASQVEQAFLTKPDFTSAAKILNLKYIVLRKDVDWQIRSNRNPQVNETELKEKGYVKEADFDQLSVYSIPGIEKTGKIWATPNIVEIYPSYNLMDIQMIPNYSNEAVYSGKDEMTLPAKRLYKPVIYFQTTNDRFYSDEDALARLLYARYLPGSTFYPLIRFKEIVERGRITDQDGRFIFDLTKLGKRLVEIYRLHKVSNNPSLTEKLMDNYFQKWDGLFKNYPEYVSNVGTNKYRLLFWEEIRKHMTLLKSISGDRALKFETLMRDHSFLTYYKIEIPVLKENSSFQVYTYDVHEGGKYNLLMDVAEWDRFFEPLMEKVDIQINGQVETVLVARQDSLYRIGELNLASGRNELVLASPRARNLARVTEAVLNSTSSPAVEITLEQFDPFASYELAFDYRFKKGNLFSLTWNYDNDWQDWQNKSSAYGTDYKFDGYDHQWRNETITFAAKSGSSNLKLTFMIQPYSPCQPSKSIFAPKCEISKETEVELGNIRVSKVFTTNTYLYRESNESSGSPMDVSYEKVNPTQYKVKVSGATGKHVLVFSELFHPGWEARFVDGSVLPKDSHFLINAYANGWVIDKTGDYEVTLEFTPQRLLKLGEKISWGSYLVGLLLVGVDIWLLKKSRLSV